MSIDEPLLDGLARSLARPMRRRKALMVFGGAVAAVALPGAGRPAVARSRSRAGGTQVCYAETADCFQITCPSDRICCLGPDDPATITPCPTNPHCCNPCDPQQSQCLGDGNCGPGPIDPAACCASRGLQACGSSGLCCAADQICDSARGVCCPADPDPPKCNEPETECRRRADDLVSRQKASVDTGVGYGMSDALEGATATAIFDVYSRFSEYDKCPQVPSDSDCDGGRCDPSTLRCRQCAPSGRSATIDSGAVALHPSDPAVATAARVTRAEVAKRLRKRHAQREKAARRFLALARKPRPGTRSDPELARAIEHARDEVVRLRRSVARGRGGKPQAYVLDMCDDLALGLGRLRDAFLEDDRTEAQRLALAAKAPIRRGLKRARRLKAVTGCGKRCL